MPNLSAEEQAHFTDALYSKLTLTELREALLLSRLLSRPFSEVTAAMIQANEDMMVTADCWALLPVSR